MWEFEPVPPLEVSREGLIAQKAIPRHSLGVNAVLWRRDVHHLRRAAGLVEEQANRLEVLNAAHSGVMGWVAALQA